MSLVVFTGLCGLLAAPVPVHPVLGFAAVLCIALGRRRGGALNQWYEADLDAKMKRTANRPLPAGRMDRQTALHFGVGLAVFLGRPDGPGRQSSGGGASWPLSILFYVLVYTVWLKRRTAQNIVIGGAAGAFPPLIGWVAATGEYRRLPLLLFAIIFLWTPPHFWALSLFVRSDYAAAGVPMLPVVAGVEATRRQILLYTPADDRRRHRALGAWPGRLALRRVARRPQRRLPRRWPCWSPATARPSRSGMGPEKRLFAFSDPLSVRPVRGAGRRQMGAGMSPIPEDEVRRRQRERAR